jgi:hypothetical protein
MADLKAKEKELKEALQKEKEELKNAYKTSENAEV